MTERCDICAREHCTTIEARGQLELVLLKRTVELPDRTAAYYEARDACRRWLAGQPPDTLTAEQREDARKQRTIDALGRYKPKPPGRFSRR